MPKKTETAANPKPSRAKTIAPKASAGRPPKYDWSALRRAYIRGDNTVTLESLAAITGSPSKRQLERRCSAEDWPDLRAELRRQTDGKLQAIDADLKAEVRLRHAEAGKSFLDLATSAMQYQNPEALEPIDIARFAKIGADLERKALGMEEVNIRLGRIRSPDDLDKLSEADLWQIAGMLPPEDDDDEL